MCGLKAVHNILKREDVHIEMKRFRLVGGVRRLEETVAGLEDTQMALQAREE